MISTLTPSISKTLTLTALLAAVLFTVGQAHAGTQMPPWKKARLAALAELKANPPQTTTPVIEVVEEIVPPANSGGGTTGGSQWGSGSGGEGEKPVAAPSPSAVLGGMALMGLIAGRRNRKNDAE
ncbi:MAG: hypothetical protein AAGH99_03955 [Planctomycetota bacterium]